MLKKKEVKKAFKMPYIGISHDTYDIVYTCNGDYSVIISCHNPVLQYAADRDAYYDFHSLYSNLIKTLGAGYTIQKQDIITRKTYQGKQERDFLSQKYNDHFKGRPYNEATTNLVITRNVKRAAFFSYDQKGFDAFIKRIGKVLDTLRSKGLGPRVLHQKEIDLYLKRILAFDFNHERFSLNNFKGKEDGIYMEDKVIKSITLVDVDEINLPAITRPCQNVNDPGFSFPVDLLSFLQDVPAFDSILYNQVVCIPEQVGELHKLQRKKQRHRSIPDPANEASVEDIDNLLTEVAKNSQMLVYAHFNIVVKSDLEKINTVTNFIESALFNQGVTPSRNAYNQLELFRTCLPGNTGELKPYDRFLTTSDAAICFLYKERLVSGEASGFKISFCDRQGIPVTIDTSDLPMETGRINNRNKFVLGPSGSGKSFFMNHLVRQYLLNGTDVVLVDTGHSYKGLCRYCKGKYITYEEDRPITMNPFNVTAEEYNEEKREFIKTLVGLCWKGADATLTQVEDTLLSSVIEAYYADHFSNPGRAASLSFNSFFEFSLRKIKEITETSGITFDLLEYTFILKRFYKGGNYERTLNEEADVSLFNEPFIVFEIDAIKEHKVLFPITTIIIMDVFLQKMRHKHNRKALIIEEAWKAIASPMMAGYMVYLYKTVRKFWGEAIVVTQELEDIIGNAIVKDSIINNSDTVCLLDQTKFRDNYDQVAKLLSISEVEQKKIFTVNNLDNKQGRGRFKEVYIARGTKGEVYGVEVSLYEYLTFTTERKEKEALERYVAEKKDFITGLQCFVEDLENSGLTLSDFVDKVHSEAPYSLQTAL